MKFLVILNKPEGREVYPHDRPGLVLQTMDEISKVCQAVANKHQIRCSLVEYHNDPPKLLSNGNLVCYGNSRIHTFSPVIK